MKNSFISGLESLNLLKYALYRDYDKPRIITSMNLTQERILLALNDGQETSSMQDIARHIGMEKGLFSQVIDKLQKQRLVVRERAMSDKRYIHLKLTDEGIKLKEKIQHHMNTHFKQVLSKLSQCERDKLMISLKEINCIAQKLLA